MGKAERETERDILVTRAMWDSSAFILLYDIYYEKIFKYCLHRLRSRQIVEDITSTIFIQAARNIRRFGGRTRTEFIEWLYAIATTQINSCLNKKGVTETLSAIPAETPEKEKISWAALHSAMLGLKLREQTILALRFFEDLPPVKIARITNDKPENVRIRISEALERLGKLSAETFETEKQFEDLIRKLEINDSADGGHKEKLRAKIPPAFDFAEKKTGRIFLYFTAAAAVLIAAGILFYRPAKQAAVRPPITQKQAIEINSPQQAEKTRLEMIKQLAAEKNIEELFKILKGDDLPARLLAAKYLATITDSNTKDLLKLATKGNDTNTATTSQQKNLLIKTVSKKTNLPLSNVSLRIRLNKDKPTDVSTDSNGLYLLDLTGEPLSRLHITAKKKGYANMRINRYSSGELTFYIPAVISFEMPAVIEAGGMVKNRQLEPIEGAEVKILVQSGSNSEIPTADVPGEFKTDANGVWKCSTFPQDVCDVSITASHPDYAVQERYIAANVEELKDFSYTLTLEKGATVSGRVLDWNQKPLRAAIIKGDYRHQEPVICDEEGQFHFNNVALGTEVFTAQCKGAAPQMHKVEVHPDAEPIVFNLASAKTIRGRVVDADGAPLNDVHITAESWQGFNSLNFETTSDANGNFHWSDAPADKVLFGFYKAGYMSISNFAMTSENDYVITLLPPLEISGTVTSSDPNRPVKTFAITPGYYKNNSTQIIWQSYKTTVFSGDKYKLMITEPFDAQLRIESDGFYPFESLIIPVEQNPAVYNFILEPKNK